MIVGVAGNKSHCLFLGSFIPQVLLVYSVLFLWFEVVIVLTEGLALLLWCGHVCFLFQFLQLPPLENSDFPPYGHKTYWNSDDNPFIYAVD